MQMQSDLEKRLLSKVDLVSSAGLSPHISPHIHNDMMLTIRDLNEM